MSTDFDRQALVSIFLAEAEDSLAKLWQALHPSDGSIPSKGAVSQEYIVAHTLKGASSLYGYTGVAKLTDVLERLIERTAEIDDAVWSTTIDELRDLTATIRRQIDAIKERGGEDPASFEDWSDRFPHLAPEAEPVAAADSPSLPQIDLSECYLLPEIDPEVASYFAPEAQEYVEAMEASLLRLEKSPDDLETIQQLFRTTHTLKGSAHTVGFKCIGDIIHHVEDFVGAIREGRTTMTGELTDVMFRAIDVVKVLMRRDGGSLQHTRREFAATMQRLLEFRTAVLGDASTELAAVPSTASANHPDEAAAQDGRRPDAEVKKDAEPRAMDESAVIRVSRDRLERLLNLVGELVISRGRLEQRLMALEQLSNQLLMFKGRMLESVRAFEEKHAFTLPSSTPSQTMTSQGAPSAVQIQNLADFGVLEFDRYDDFNILARRLTEVSADVGESMAQLNASIRKAREDMGQLQHLSLGMRDEIARARMVPIGTPFVRFRRSVREMAKLTGKQVGLVTSGEHTEVDTGVVERLVDPLIHLVRNAVYHGIEPAAVRVAKGKPATGSVYLNAAHRGNAVIIEVEDDGAGIDLAKVKTKAAALGLIRPESVGTMSDADAIKMIFLPGFSTAEQVGDVAGRGVGMDVVKQTLESINGQIEVETEPGVGTKFTLRLPLTLLISTALLVRVGHERYALPLPNIREVVMPAPGGVQEVGGRPILQVGDEAVEVQALAQLLGSDRAAPAGPCPVVIIRSATGVHGLEVDELLGRQEIVIKALGALKPFQESSFVGATIDPEGRVVLVLDISKLLSARVPDSIELPSPEAVPLLSDQTGGARDDDRGAAGDAVRILLIDDSLSIRKFVGKMLQSAGYEVDTAIDGEEGLRKAATGVYRLIITDLEMPKLNGYEVIQALRDRPQTKSTPILVMTTRAGEKHRQMALSVGASGYIAKPVEERALTLEVSRWTGHIVGLPS